MTDYSAHSLNDLIDVITTWPVGMPVRAMERVLTIGESTVPSLIEALERWRVMTRVATSSGPWFYWGRSVARLPCSC